MKTEMRHAYVLATGIKARCRKTDRHHIDIGDFPMDTNRDEVIEQAKKKLVETMKSTQKASFHWDFCEIEKDGGFDIRTMRLFDQRNERIQLIA